jgi:hypothetical protein
MKSKKINSTGMPVIVLITGFLFYSFGNYGSSGSDDITADDVLAHIKYLASDELGGRFPGTKGDSLTDEYLINELTGYGVIPKGEDGWRQSFDFISEIKPGDKNLLSITFAKEEHKYTLGHDFYPVSYSSTGKVEGEVVFAGYGINAPDQNYNDFNGIDFNGKIALIMRYTPGYNDPHNDPFAKNENLRIKCSAVKEAGASAILVFIGPQNGEDELSTKLKTSGVKDELGIPVINIKRELVEKMLGANGKVLNELQKEIDSSRSPRSFALTNVKIRIETDLIHVNSYTDNIIGYLEGTDAVLKNEVIVIGAHKDHLGDGLKYGSLYGKEEPAIHNGADDNASGTAGVLELAQKLASQKDKLRRSYVFMLFGAEEAGSLGSSYFTKSGLFKSFNIVSMINMDMIGRVTDNKLIINGAGTSSIWKSVIDSLNKLNENLAVTYKDEGYGPSDHSSFYSKDIPVLHFFTGTHTDYHRPSDDWNLINAGGEAKVLNLMFDLVTVLDLRESKPDFIKTKDDKQTMPGFKVTLGVVPDYASNVEGLQIMGVKEGGPAQKAGLVGGDVIIKLGPHNIKNIYDYTYALGQFKPGDETEVMVKRGDEELTFKVSFTGK